MGNNSRYDSVQTFYFMYEEVLPIYMRKITHSIHIYFPNLLNDATYPTCKETCIFPLEGLMELVFLKELFIL